MHRDPLLEISICQELWEHRVDGIILAGGGFDQVTYNDRLSDLVERLRSMNILAVSLTKRNLPVPCFAPDNARAGAMAAEHVLAHGHSDVAVIVGPVNSQVTRIRLKAIRKVFHRVGIVPKVIYTDFGEAAEEDVARDLLALVPKVTAIIASGDRIGLSLTHLLMARGWRVPENISIISIGSTYLGRQSYPRLTAIDTALAECSAAAVNYIADSLDGAEPAKPRLGTVSLIPGESMRDIGGGSAAAGMPRVEPARAARTT
jgi:LacI family transcriptional regulator